MSVKYKLNYFR